MAESLTSLLNERIAHSSDKVALRFGSSALTWGEIAAHVRAFVTSLDELPIVAQRRMVFLGKNSPACFVALFGSSIARLVYVPVNWRLAAAEIESLLDDVDPCLVVVDREFSGTVDLWNRRRAERVPVQFSDSLWGSVVEPVRSSLPMRSESVDIAFQLYTSGTTGEPKGAMFDNGRNIVTLTTEIAPMWGFRHDDVSLACLPLFHMGGLAWAIAGVASDVTTVLVADFDPESLIDIGVRERVTTAFFVPAMITALLAFGERLSELTYLRRITYSGAPIAPAVVGDAMKLIDCEFAQIYGLTEATGAFAQLDPVDHDPHGPRRRLLLSAGRPYPWVQVRVVDPVTEAVVPDGQPGEIWIRSSQTLVGYFGKPEETRSVLTRDSWLRTGDIGRIEDGYIFLLDRAKDVIISGGENVYPVEIEKVLAGYAPVAEAAVIGVPSAKWGETVKAVVVARSGYIVDPAELIAYTRSQLASFKCPTSVDVVMDLPRTATGKVRKGELREQYWSELDRRIN